MKPETTTILSARVNAINSQDIAQQHELKNLEHIKNSEQQLNHIQQELDKLIDAITHNPSRLSRAATFWGNLSLWKKIALGASILIPLLILSILTQFISCYFITIVLLAAYISSSIVLDDHANHTRLSMEYIKAGISSLAAGLSAIIGLLEQIGEQLAQQVNRFKEENDHFEEQVNELNAQNQHLNAEITSLQSIEHQLDSTEKTLTLLCAKLQEKECVQNNLIEITQNELQKKRVELNAVFTELKEQTAQLDDIQNEMKQTTKRYEQSVNEIVEMSAQLKISAVSENKNTISIGHTNNQNTMFNSPRIKQLLQEIDAARTCNNELIASMSQNIV